MVNRKLMNAFRYEPEDLFDNTAGDLSPTQAQALSAQQLQRGRNRYPIIVGVGIAVALVSFFISDNWIDYTLSQRQLGFSVMVIGWVILLGLVVNTVQLVSRFRQDLVSGKVEQLCGTMILQPSRSWGRNRFWLFYKGTSFPLNQEQYEAMENNKQYCLYVTPFSGTIVAVADMTAADTPTEDVPSELNR